MSQAEQYSSLKSINLSICLIVSCKEKTATFAHGHRTNVASSCFSFPKKRRTLNKQMTHLSKVYSIHVSGSFFERTRFQDLCVVFFFFGKFLKHQIYLWDPTIKTDHFLSCTCVLAHSSKFPWLICFGNTNVNWRCNWTCLQTATEPC